MIKTKNKKTSKVKSKVVRCKTVKKKIVKKKTVKKKIVKKKVVKKKVVKKKVVKKKVVKKKVVKKKVVKKKAKKKAKKKTRKYKKRKKILMEDIYAIINKVQFGKRKITFVTELAEAPTIENNIRDVGLKYDKVDMKTQVVFTIHPNDEKYEDEMDNLHFDIMDDEIPDIGQIFG
jgi:hypothetical protein